MFKRILIAARGEIALRVLRCCREMDIETVVVYSEADRKSLPVMLATRAVCIGPARAQESYLRADVIIETAKRLKCEAIHPGYGFLSENPEFARRCAENGLVFIGPSAEVMRELGDKDAAKRLMRENGVPVVPGSDGLVRDTKEALAEALRVGFPVLLKASAGGGGKGIRRADTEAEIAAAFEAAKAEAEAAFGNGDLYLEKLIEHPRHIEVQILADREGNTVYLGERDCSIQKNHQKLLEEAPSSSVDEALGKRMGEAAVRAAKAAGYTNAGTVEFILDADESYYFIEMNTRIQVEHPVTEQVTGIDLVREQLRIAAGRRLELTQEDVRVRGHAIECRINALSTGEIRFLHFPSGYGVRVESHAFSGYEVGPYYDAMLAKLIVTGVTRLEVIRRLRRALEELIIDGVRTNADFMHVLTYHPAFLKGRYDTSFFETYKKEIEGWLNDGNGAA